MALGVFCSGVNFGIGRSLERWACAAISSTAPLPPQAETTSAAPNETPMPVSTFRRFRLANNGRSVGDAGSGARRSGSCGASGGTVSQAGVGNGPIR